MLRGLDIMLHQRAYRLAVKTMKAGGLKDKMPMDVEVQFVLADLLVRPRLLMQHAG